MENQMVFGKNMYDNKKGRDYFSSFFWFSIYVIL